MFKKRPKRCKAVCHVVYYRPRCEYVRDHTGPHASGSWTWQTGAEARDAQIEYLLTHR